jgi:predicted acetyltransferase
MSGGTARSAGLVLRRPTLDEEPEFIRAYRATTPETPNHVPSTFLFAFDGARIVGRVSIRHALNESLLRVGGHIGYVVVPEFRRQGHATAILRLAVQFARDTLGLDRVLVTCEDDNVGSIKTIEKNGGVLENLGVLARGKPQRRYWIASRC